MIRWTVSFCTRTTTIINSRSNSSRSIISTPSSSTTSTTKLGPAEKVSSRRPSRPFLSTQTGPPTHSINPTTHPHPSSILGRTLFEMLTRASPRPSIEFINIPLLNKRLRTIIVAQSMIRTTIPSTNKLIEMERNNIL